MPSSTAIKTVAMRRLAVEKRGEVFQEFHQRVQTIGVPAESSWKVALFAYSPLDGSPPELLADVEFAEVASDWRSGKYRNLGEPPWPYKFPAGMEELSGSYVRATDAHMVESWEDLESLVHPDKKATKQQILQWAFHNSGVRMQDIDPEAIPCRGATTVLRLAREDYRTFVDRWLKDEEQSAGLEELSDDCREHLRRCELYEGYLLGQREEVFPAVEEGDEADE